MKKIFSALIALISTICIAFSFGGCDKTMETPLSRDDLDSIEHYHEPTIDEDFEDNIVYVILKSAFNSLEEISFKDIKIVEKVSKIDYVDLYTKEIPYSKDGIIPLGISRGHHMFRIVLEEHSKEKVLKVVGLLRSLDMVLISGPIYRGEVEYCWTPNDAEYSSQWGLNGINGINAEQAWDITRGGLDVKIG